jgi:large subunit ribosomal protein L1
MEKQQVAEAIKKLKEQSQKRNFKQTVDLIINLKNLDLKKPDQQVDFFMNLHFPRHKKPKVCGLVGGELWESAKESLDNVIYVDDFPEYQKDKRKAKKLAREYDFFIAQANIMTKVAQAFGRTFGPLGKMPNPKAGCVVPPNANLEQLKERLGSTVRVLVKSHLAYQIAVGYEDTAEEEMIDNILTIYGQLEHHLPQEKNNIKSTVLKFTMGKPVKIGEE